MATEARTTAEPKTRLSEMTATPAAKPSLKKNGMTSTASLGKAIKTVKMIQARCRVCNLHGQGRRGWWEECTHNPYFTTREVEIKKPVLEKTEDGRTLKVGETIEVEYYEDPNWKQIADDVKVMSGRGVQIQRERGAKFPHELGYEDVCDFFNCWEKPNPKYTANRIFEDEGVQIMVGHYHTRDEAALLTLRGSSTLTYVGYDKDRGRRKEQMDEVNIQ